MATELKFSEDRFKFRVFKLQKEDTLTDNAKVTRLVQSSKLRNWFADGSYKNTDEKLFSIKTISSWPRDNELSLQIFESLEKVRTYLW